MTRSDDGFSGIGAVLGIGAGLGVAYLVFKSRPASASASRSLRSINEETNERFWDRTNYKRGQKLDPKDPADAAMIPVWLEINAEVTREAARSPSGGSMRPPGDTSYPSWHAHYAALVGSPVDRAVLRSGCKPDANGNIQCAPETMRAGAEKQLMASGFWPSGKPLDLATYTLARNIQSEVGSSTPEERVALGESTVNHGLSKASTRQDAALSAALYTQSSRLYGEINNPSGGSLKSGRFTSTSKDPTVLTTLLADFVISGKSGDFAQGADDQDGLEYRSSFAVPMNRVMQYARGREPRYWVGPLPGVDHWRLSLFRKYGFKADSPEGRELIERSRKVFGNPVYDGNRVAKSMRPVWPVEGGK